MTISTDTRALANYLRSKIGGQPKVTKFWDEAHQNSIDVMCVDGVPEEGISTLSTLGLSETSIGLDVEDKPLRVELMMSCRTSQGSGENIISTCAFNVINSSMTIKPGTVFRKIVEMYRPDSAMRHILFSSPYLWDMKTQDFETKKVAWLIAVPVSDKEYEFCLSNGSDALENLLEEKSVDIFDLDRMSVV